MTNQKQAANKNQVVKGEVQMNNQKQAANQQIVKGESQMNKQNQAANKTKAAKNQGVNEEVQQTVYDEETIKQFVKEINEYYGRTIVSIYMPVNEVILPMLSSIRALKQIEESDNQVEAGANQVEKGVKKAKKGIKKAKAGTEQVEVGAKNQDVKEGVQMNNQPVNNQPVNNQQTVKEEVQMNKQIFVTKEEINQMFADFAQANQFLFQKYTDNIANQLEALTSRINQITVQQNTTSVSQAESSASNTNKNNEEEKQMENQQTVSEKEVVEKLVEEINKYYGKTVVTEYTPMEVLVSMASNIQINVQQTEAAEEDAYTEEEKALLERFKDNPRMIQILKDSFSHSNREKFFANANEKVKKFADQFEEIGHATVDKSVSLLDTVIEALGQASKEIIDLAITTSKGVTKIGGNVLHAGVDVTAGVIRGTGDVIGRVGK